MSIDVLARAWKHSTQDSSALLALLALASMAHDDGVLWMRGVTVEYIGQKARTKVRQTQRILRSLQQAGEIYAPPAVGRGNTTRYFVTIGLSQAEIIATLRLEFEQTPALAAHTASEILRLQKVSASTPFVDSVSAPEDDIPAKKVSASTPIAPEHAASVQEEHGEKVSSSTPIGEKVSSRAIKGVMYDAENSDPSPIGSAKRDPIHGDPNHGSSDRSRARAFLRNAGFYNGSIRKILAMDIEQQTLEASIEALASAGWGAGAIFNELRDNPPQKGIPYERPDPQRSPPSTGAERHAAPTLDRPRARRGSHNPTGGAELRDPGWMDREIARIKALTGEL